jgi:hypothetical protein
MALTLIAVSILWALIGLALGHTPPFFFALTLLVAEGTIISKREKIVGAVSLRLGRGLPRVAPDELADMERGARAWFRIEDALYQPGWTGPQTSDSRRSAATEVLELSSTAAKSLVHDSMTREDRAWLAFGLERLAEELERQPAGSIDHIGYAIHNRQALRMANELVRRRPSDPALP